MKRVRSYRNACLVWLLILCLLLTACGQPASGGEETSVTSGRSGTTAAPVSATTPAVPAKPTAEADACAKGYAADIFSLLAVESEMYEIAPQELTGAYFSAGFSVQDADTFYYALVGTDRVMGILTVFRSGEKYTASYGKDFAAVLTEAWRSERPFALRWDDSIPFAELAVVYDGVGEENDVSEAIDTVFLPYGS